MSRIFISGSSTGLGLMAADLLVSKGHNVVLHARNAKRADEARQELPQSEAIVIGDIGTIAGAKDLAAQVNALGHFDAVIHNAAVGYREGHHVKRIQRASSTTRCSPSLSRGPEAHDVALQDRLIAICSDVSGVVLPA